MKRKKTYLILFAATGIFASLTFLFYWKNFAGTLSQSSSDWGNFGSYVAGTLGIILSTANFIFLYLTFKEQQLLNNQQQFESIFFNLLKAHQDMVAGASDYKSEIDFTYQGNEQINGYELLELLRNAEEQKAEAYLKYFNTSVRYYVLPAEHKNLTNYSIVKNRYLTSKEYLIAITESIVEIIEYIKSSTKISRDLESFYLGVFTRSLRKSEKFFLIMFYLQDKPIWKSNNVIDRGYLNQLFRLDKVSKKLLLDAKNTDWFPVTTACGFGEIEGATSPQDKIMYDTARSFGSPAHYMLTNYDLPGSNWNIEHITIATHFPDNGIKELKMYPEPNSRGHYQVYISELLHKVVSEGLILKGKMSPTDENIRILFEKHPEFSISISWETIINDSILVLKDVLTFVCNNGELLVSCSPVYCYNTDYFLMKK